ncbi:MAG: hypothetical protein E6R14_02840 [Thermomicrobiales bacterium]|nr:MAG: hypothetical protein E6R14_02840 [Thermomicrobiales bacterium]
MMQSPQLIHALAKRSDHIAPPRHIIERAPAEPAPVRHPDHAAMPRLAQFWQLLFGRRGSVAS